MSHPLRNTFVGNSIVRLADEGVPIGALSRTFKVPFDSAHSIVRLAMEDGVIAKMPASDWPAGAAVRAPTVAPVRSDTVALPEGADAGVRCPCCGMLTSILSANLLARAYELPPQQEAILTRIWQGKGKPVTGEACIEAMYADRLDGGPEYETARKYFKTQLCLLRQRIEGSGVRILAAGYQRGFKLVLASGADFRPVDEERDDDMALGLQPQGSLVIEHEPPAAPTISAENADEPAPKVRKKRTKRQTAPAEQAAPGKRTKKRSPLRQKNLGFRWRW